MDDSVSIPYLTPTETFLYGFVVPILSYMLEIRLHADPRHTQQLTSAVLAVHGLVSAISGPVIGHFADKISNRKTPLLVSLVGCIVGTILVAAATSLWVLLIGRALQGIAGSAVWIIGLSTVAERVGEENLGKVMGMANSFITAGSISGPMVAGLLFEALGYWPTWAAPLAVLVLDIIARLVLVEKPRSCPTSPDPLSPPPSLSTPFDASEQERSPLLSEALDSYQSLPNPPRDPEEADLSTSSSFYRAMLGNGRVLAALLTSMAVAVVIVGMDATLPLHVRDVFGWGPGQTGMMFLYLQVPSIFIGPLSGWVRDCVGLRYPVSLSLATFAPLMWLQGVPGDRRFPWASADTRGPTIYIASMLAIGTVTPFLTGIGILEVTGESWHSPCWVQSITDTYISCCEGIYGREPEDLWSKWRLLPGVFHVGRSNDVGHDDRAYHSWVSS